MGSLLPAWCVNLVALFLVPHLAGPYRLAKWAVWGGALAVLAILAAREQRQKGARLLPADRALFSLTALFVVSAVALPLAFTLSATAHLAGTLRLAMGFSFSYLAGIILTQAAWHQKRNTLAVIAFGGVLLAVIIILQAANPQFLTSTFTLPREFRTPGTLGNPNWAAAFLLPLVPILLGLRADLPAAQDYRRMRQVYLAGAVLTAAATVLTFSKGGMLGLAAGIYVFALLDRKMGRRTRILLLAAALAGVVAVTAYASFFGLFSTLTWTRGRLFIWTACLSLIFRHPFGAGLGAFPAVYPQALPQLLGGDPTVYMPLHPVEFAYNDTLQLAVEGGLLAPIVFLALVALLVVRSMQGGNDLSRGVGAAIASIALYGCVDSPLQLPATSCLWWFFIGWMMAGAKQGSSDEGGRENDFRQSGWLPTAMFSAIVLLGLVQMVRLGAADILWSQAQSSRNQDQEYSLQKLRAAAHFMPENNKIRSDLAKANFQTGRIEEAITEIDQAMALGFRFDDFFLKQKLMMRIFGSSAVRKGWEDAARNFPALFRPHFELGQIYLREGNPEAARMEFETVLRIQQGRDDQRFHNEAARILRLIEEQRQAALLF